MAYQKTEKVKKKIENKKESIIKVAKEVLANESYSAISIKSIAKKAGIATGTFYLYFSNKEKLVETIVDEMYAKLLDSIKKERAKHEQVIDKLQASMEATIRLFAKEQHLAKILLVQIPSFNHAFNRKLDEIEKELIKLTLADLKELTDQGMLPKQDIQISAMAFVGSFRQVMISWLREGEPKNIEEAYQTLIQYNLRGLGKS
ncbi:TetR/AcrR family transcriptional regulator [Tepidibacillus infernus]|uniref:TetR family transcriptional regulator n=1 Tax=Tepidibacillus decaturensis TaxID=1413211 RepID=A0A135L5V1_9BACI|nr:TetR/AcrR family transcriptional regulator [Tepidibacillus decaturensis]KXG44289.1 TetR family transcriptional regulator [Tepidibacillus decaturensis]